MNDLPIHVSPRSQASQPVVAVIIGHGFVGGLAKQALERRGIAVKQVSAPRLIGKSSAGDVDLPSLYGNELAALEELVQGATVVINAAGIAESTSGESNALTGANGLLPGLVGLACQSAGVSRYIHVSSAAVQGRRPTLDSAWDFDSQSPYSDSKLLGEMTARASGFAGTVIYRPPGVHASERSVTRSLARLARTRLSSVAAPGSHPTPQALATNIGDAIAHLALTPNTPPIVVHHPAEGLTVEQLLVALAGRKPLHIPTPLAQLTISCGLKLAQRFRSTYGYVRRLEILWFGQEQAQSWLSDDGWSPPRGTDEWRRIGQSVSRRHLTQNRQPKILLGVTSGISVPGFFRGLLSSLAADGWDTLVTASPNERARAVVEGEGGRYIEVQAERKEAPLSDVKTLVRLVRVLLAERPTVAVWGTPKAGLLGSIASWLTSTPSVYVLHGLRLETLSGMQRRMMLLTERVAMACSDETIAVGKELRLQAIDLKLVTPNRIKVLGYGSANGVPAPKQLPKRNGAVGTLSTTPVVGFVGRITRDKGIIDLLKAWPTVHEKTGAELLLAGHREADSFDEPIASLLRDTPGTKYVGDLETLDALYSSLDIIVLPSYREGLPTVILEAASFAVPAVVTNATGLREVVIDGETGLVVPLGSVGLLGKALTHLCSDPHLRAELGERAQQLVTARYSQQFVHQNWVEHLSSFKRRAESPVT